jgi:hypothetical protein
VTWRIGRISGSATDTAQRCIGTTAVGTQCTMLRHRRITDFPNEARTVNGSSSGLCSSSSNGARSSGSSVGSNTHTGSSYTTTAAATTTTPTPTSFDISTRTNTACGSATAGGGRVTTQVHTRFTACRCINSRHDTSGAISTRSTHAASSNGSTSSTSRTRTNTAASTAIGGAKTARRLRCQLVHHVVSIAADYHTVVGDTVVDADLHVRAAP